MAGSNIKQKKSLRCQLLVTNVANDQQTKMIPKQNWQEYSKLSLTASINDTLNKLNVNLHNLNVRAV